MSLESLLDFSKPIDVGLLDKAVAALYEAGENLNQVQQVLVAFQNNPEAWTQVGTILEKSQNPQAKILALNTLEQCVKFRWQTLPVPQRDGIKSFIVNLIIKVSSDAEVAKTQPLVLKKLNMVLVQIVKQDWPHNWPNFITELVTSSKTSQALCANNMNILLLLSEEVFDYSTGQMTQEKMKNMKKNLNKEFTLIFQLCEFILENAKDSILLAVTLRTLLRFLGWIPVAYIFETKLIELLALKFFRAAEFQNDALKCLAEIAAIDVPDRPQYNSKFVQLFSAIIDAVSKLITPETDIAKIYATGDEKVCTFVRYFTLFITGFLKTHLSLLETAEPATQQLLLLALRFLIRISQVEDPVIFKICLEYWNHLVVELFNTQRQSPQAAQHLRAPVATPFLDTPLCPRVQFYAEVLSHLRRVMISKMAKPEEVLVVEDDNGDVVREMLKDTDSIILYKTMRECLIYLTHLDPNDTQNIMQTKLIAQVDGTEWSWHNLNTLCWAVGSISGALPEHQEKTFLVRVIKELLGLCEMKRGKEHKAIIASNIMYVVGQYPQFLKQHWKFLKTVVNKLFEFMHEKHPGVQDMSCDTFLKIAKKCKKKFVLVNPNETRAFVEEILDNLPDTIRDLEISQIHTFYETVGIIIQSQPEPAKRQQLIAKLMELPNNTWAQIVQQVQHNRDVLWDMNTVQQVVLVLRANNRVAQSLGNGYIVQLSRLYVEALQVYRSYSQYITTRVQQEGENASKLALVRGMRVIKKETLKLIQTFVSSCQDADKDVVLKQLLPPLLELVLDDYQRSIPECRELEVLSLFATVITKLGAAMNEHVPRLFDSVIRCTLEMITKNFQDFPDHRTAFFSLLQAVNAQCFQALITRLAPGQFQVVMDSIVWAMKHLQKDIADTGLQILQELLVNVESSPDIANKFYAVYFTSLLQDLLGVMTDAFHKSAFTLHATILAHLFKAVDRNVITVPLWKEGQYQNNGMFVRVHVATMIRKSFPNVAPKQIEGLVVGLFSSFNDVPTFKTHLRDFLVQIKEFSAGGDNSELFSEEQLRAKAQQEALEKARVLQVPGLLYQGGAPSLQPALPNP